MKLTRNQVIAIKRAFEVLMAIQSYEAAGALAAAFPDLELADSIWENKYGYSDSDRTPKIY